MTKNMKMFVFRDFAEAFLTSWESEKKEMKLNGKALFNLVGLKKKIENQLMQIQDTILNLVEQHHGIPDGKGNYTIPEEERAVVGEAMNELSGQEVEIDYEPIKIHESDVVSPSFLDIIFDFVVFDE